MTQIPNTLMEICIRSKLLSFYTPKMNAVIKYWQNFPCPIRNQKE